MHKYIYVYIDMEERPLDRPRSKTSLSKEKILSWGVCLKIGCIPNPLV